MSDVSTTNDMTPETTKNTTNDTTNDTTNESARDVRYRARLRETEAERDRLRAALLPHLRAAAERAAGSRLADPSSLWLLPEAADPMTLLDDDLGLDEQRVTAAVDKLLAYAPGLARRSGSADGGARSLGSSVPSVTWGDVLNPR